MGVESEIVIYEVASFDLQTIERFIMLLKLLGLSVVDVGLR